MHRARLCALVLVSTASVAFHAVAGAETSPVAAPTSAPRVLKSQPQSGASRLVDVSTGTRASGEFVVFEFEGSLPTFKSVRYVRRIVEDGSGRPVPVSGKAFLEVTFMTTCGPPGAPPSCPSAPRVPAAFQILQQVAFAGYFEGNASYGLGLTRRVDFRVRQLSNPPRVIIDLFSRGADGTGRARPAQAVRAVPRFTG